MTRMDRLINPLEIASPLNADAAADAALADHDAALPKSASRRRTLAGLGAALIPSAVPSGLACMGGLAGMMRPPEPAISQDAAPGLPHNTTRLQEGCGRWSTTDNDSWNLKDNKATQVV